MIKQIYFFILFTLMTATTGFGQIQKINMDSVSYGFGVLIAQNLQKQGVDSLDIASFSKALEDVLSGKELEMTAAEANAKIQKYMAAQQAKKYEPIIKEGAEFLAANGAKEGVTTTESGLQYEVLTPGSGAKPTASDKVTVHYTGKLISGKVFDSSVERGQPASFGVTQVIGGWTEALQLMEVGAKWRLTIPYNLAYGERGAGQDIPPYATLIFDVELISIQ
ncbi:MAG: FKBP-type peptidyl-prolyl cis-trans isomerase [Saprospiraceae bacterium]